MNEREPLHQITSIKKLSAYTANGCEALILLDHADVSLNIDLMFRRLRSIPGATKYVVCQSAHESDVKIALEKTGDSNINIICLPDWSGGYLSHKDEKLILERCRLPDLILSAVGYNQSGAIADKFRPPRGRMRKLLLEASVIGIARRAKSYWVIVNDEYDVTRMANWRDLLDRTAVRPIRLFAYILFMPMLLTLACLIARKQKGKWIQLNKS